jgi:diguanylate cyclase (GGDEF)-like protein/PAS domain S-box-containing protein
MTPVRRASRALLCAVVMFAVGLVFVVAALSRYDDAYAWVAHTSDVRLVIGRALGHSRHVLSCDGLRADLAEFKQLTADNPIQQDRVSAVRDSIEQTCATGAASNLVDRLARLDATERALLADRRERLAATRRWCIIAFVLAMLGAVAATLVARLYERRAVRALHASEELFRFLASTSSDLVRVHDAVGKPIYVSPSVERLLGYTPEELLGKVPLSLGHPDDLEQMGETLANIQKPHAAGSTLIYRLRAKDGAYRWFETHTNPMRDDAGRLLRFYTTARDVTDRITLAKQLELAAVTDELTGLLNRRGFLLIARQELRVAVRQHHGVGVIFADLDGLKMINDRLGHEYGDRAIRELAAILRSSFRDSDVLARLGGDEFAALAYNVDQAKLDAVINRMQSAIAKAAPVGPYPLSVSVGVALFRWGDTFSLDDLIAVADQRMYENKRTRKESDGKALVNG